MALLEKSRSARMLRNFEWLRESKALEKSAKVRSVISELVVALCRKLVILRRAEVVLWYFEV